MFTIWENSEISYQRQRNIQVLSISIENIPPHSLLIFILNARIASSSVKPVVRESKALHLATKKGPILKISAFISAIPSIYLTELVDYL